MTALGHVAHDERTDVRLTVNIDVIIEPPVRRPARPWQHEAVEGDTSYCEGGKARAHTRKQASPREEGHVLLNSLSRFA